MTHFTSLIRPSLILMSLVLSFPTMADTSNLGSIRFPNSGADDAQEDFIEGMLYMHNFEYDEAATAFKRARTIDKDFAMAYWGEALTYHHPLWNQQSRKTARDLLKTLGRTSEDRAAKVSTQREKDYLGTIEILYGMTEDTRTLTKDVLDVRYRDAMRRLHEAYPDDHEAQTLYGLSILGVGSRNREFSTYMRAAAVLTPVWDANRSHPGAAHYLIHSYDDPTHAPLGLPMARAYSKIAPAAAHAQHMTSHIFVALGMWDDLVDSNATAIRVENEGREGPLLVAGHYVYWLQYGYLQQGRYDDATVLMQAALDRMGENPKGGEKSYYGTMYARYMLDTQDWKASEKWAAPDDVDIATPNYHFARAFAAIQNGQLDKARTHMDRVKPMKGGSPEVTADEETAAVLILELKALLALAEGKTDEGVSLAQKAVEEEQALKFSFGPPHVMKPTSELLGDILLSLDRAEEAMAAYTEQLTHTPRRTQSLVGLTRAATKHGDSLVASDTQQQLAQVLHLADK
ncbi:MAG: hypothetical protein VCD00_08245 [Candidatus Hydrogenedentota bacterium]